MSNRVVRRDLVYDVTRPPYNAKGDGITDDTAAIQRAIDAAGDAGGGVVFFPAGTYLISLRSTVTLSSYKYALIVHDDNITLRGEGRNSVVTMTDEYVNGQLPILVSGQAKTAATYSAANMVAKDLNFGSLTLYTMTATAAQAASVTLASAGDAANFTVGDPVYLRSGQTIPGSDENPDAEINEITDIAGAVLSLKYPTTKAYVQEYFPDAGRNDPTTTTPSAWLADFGVVNATDVVISNFLAEKLHFDVSAATYGGDLIAVTQVINPVIEDCTATLGNTTFQGWGPHRFLTVRDNAVHLTTSLSGKAFASADRGCTDMTVRGNTFISRGGSYHGIVHANEGVANLVVKDNVFRATGSTDTSLGFFGSTGRGYNHSLTGNEFFGLGIGTLLGMTGVDGIVVSDNRMVATTGVMSFSDCTGLVLGHNDTGSGSVFIHPETTDGTAAMQPPPLSRWVFYNSASKVKIGTLPIYAIALDISIYVATAFNAGSPTIQVGNNGFANVFMASAAAVSSQGFATVARTAYSQWLSSAGADVYAWITPTGSTAGQALVTVRYIIAPQLT